jgi:chromosome partitioning protein
MGADDRTASEPAGGWTVGASGRAAGEFGSPGEGADQVDGPRWEPPAAPSEAGVVGPGHGSPGAHSGVASGEAGPGSFLLPDGPTNAAEVQGAATVGLSDTAYRDAAAAGTGGDWWTGTGDAGQTGAAPTSASGVPTGVHGNMAAAAPAAQSRSQDTPAGLVEAAMDPSVSQEAEGGGEVTDRRPEDETMEDEAAIAVREAVSRAAAQAGVSSTTGELEHPEDAIPQPDVSRETSPEGSVALDAGAWPEPVAEPDMPQFDREVAARNARVTFQIHADSMNGHRRVLAVANQKGGVGKSTTAVNLGAYLALAGARVLVVDLDPQGNASTGLGLDHRDIEPSVYDVLTGDTQPGDAIRATSVANLHVLPSTIDLAGAEVELVSAMSRESRLRRALGSIHQRYDTVLIDCPPSLGLLTVNALAAADELLIPIQCEYYALEGLGQLLRNVELVRANLNPELRIGGIVLTMYDGRTRLAEQVVEEVRKHFSDLVYETIVPRSVRLSEAPGYGLPIALYDPLSRGGIAYRDLAFELAVRSGLLAPTGEGAS